jgi:hypothetical protein
MRCAKVGRVLSLYVGHDLDSDRSREVAAHLARCERCRTLEAGLCRSRLWLESAPTPPLGESDYSAVRRGVWRRIEAEGGIAERHSPRAGRLVLAGGLLAGALLAVVLSLRPRQELQGPPTDKLDVVPPVTAEHLGLVRHGDDFREFSPDRGLRSGRRARVRPAVPEGGQSVVKIEFQTANPGVRIIWLVKKGDEVPTSAAGRNQEVS